MIASLSGTATEIALDKVILTVGGVGLLLHVTPRTAADATLGSELTLATTLVVREDSLTLYGFAQAGERDMFEMVQTVSGVGPRLALAMLAVLTPDEVGTAVRTGDLAVLTKIPGVGKKSAERLVLELKDKIVAVSSHGQAAATVSRPVADPGKAEKVAEALVGLGWNPKQAAAAVNAVEGSAGADESVSTWLRLALRELSR